MTVGKELTLDGKKANICGRVLLVAVSNVEWGGRLWRLHPVCTTSVRRGLVRAGCGALKGAIKKTFYKYFEKIRTISRE